MFMYYCHICFSEYEKKFKHFRKRPRQNIKTSHVLYKYTDGNEFAYVVQTEQCLNETYFLFLKLRRNIYYRRLGEYIFLNR